ncbi:MAG: UDP-N-acetylglucosamine--N-acetylmuramyl-(pentapeptide) pyrophosphoryl-undecaprenol N-acetylglucosamine transferase, partial [Spirochaetaceae bacterium]|nr:UDP-N-acetylglucosamine--N-acetylmuramyl-(pentapeptide) pyrophosphoryl-undecaprenol N-acetylglucosamine transferase [Spirochaetaceae bacterium]
NARFFERSGAALVLAGAEADAEHLVRAVASLAENAEHREQLAAASERLGAKDGAELIARAITGSIGTHTAKTAP